ncbi:MAG: hypothetical protein Fur0027_14520 [Raineya sp.]
MAKQQENSKQENKHTFNLAPYWANYPKANVLYVVTTQNLYLVFDDKRKAEKYQIELKELRKLESELHEIQKEI